MKILVIGGSGFLGKYLLNHLVKTNHEICNISRRKTNIPGVDDFQVDLADLVTLKFVIGRIDPDVVYHLAAQASQQPNPHNPGEVLQTNIINTFNLVHALPAKTHINFASSIVVYGNCQNPSEFSPINTTSLYGASKIACEEIIKSNYYTKGNTYNIFRLGAMVGKGLTHGILMDVIEKLRSDSPTLELWGNCPGSSKVYSHGQEVVEAITLDRFVPNEIINICNDDKISALDVAQITMESLNIYKPLIWDVSKTWKGDNPQLDADNSLMRDILQRDFTGSRAAIWRAAEENK